MTDQQNKITARVIPWEPGWGVAIDYGNGKHSAYWVSRERALAESEVQIIARGERPFWGPLSVAQD